MFFCVEVGSIIKNFGYLMILSLCGNDLFIIKCFNFVCLLFWKYFLEGGKRDILVKCCDKLGN